MRSKRKRQAVKMPFAQVNVRFLGIAAAIVFCVTLVMWQAETDGLVGTNKSNLKNADLFPIPTSGPFFTPTPGYNYSRKVREAARKISAGNRVAESAYSVLMLSGKDRNPVPQQLEDREFYLVWKSRTGPEESIKFFTYNRQERTITIYNDYAEDSWIGIHVLMMAYIDGYLYDKSAPRILPDDHPDLLRAIVESLDLGYNLAHKILGNSLLTGTDIAMGPLDNPDRDFDANTFINGNREMFLKIDPNLFGAPGSKDYLTKVNIYQYSLNRLYQRKRGYEGEKLKEVLADLYKPVRLSRN